MEKQTKDKVKKSWSNLKVMESGKVISYTTHVADIDEANMKLIIRGEFSQTTTRQMTKVANYYGLTKVQQ